MRQIRQTILMARRNSNKTPLSTHKAAVHIHTRPLLPSRQHDIKVRFRRLHTRKQSLQYTLIPRTSHLRSLTEARQIRLAEKQTDKVRCSKPQPPPHDRLRKRLAPHRRKYPVEMRSKKNSSVVPANAHPDTYLY